MATLNQWFRMTPDPRRSGSRTTTALVAVGVAFALWLSTSAQAEVAAFPGAVGQGAASLGGRGGEVYVVTTLDDYSPKRGEPKIKGSFRHALRAEMGPRTVVFNVSGVIRLREPLELHKDRVTVAGQTSPGGITLFGYPFEVTNGKDVVVRYLRVRCSDFHARPDSEELGKTGRGAGDLAGSTANAIHVGHGAERVVLDHISTSWGMDETLSVTKARNVTVQNCIVAEALDDSFHAKGRHGYGSLIRGELTPEDQRANRGGYTLYGNLWAHNRARNPSIGGEQGTRDESKRLRSDVNVVNNVVFDWSEQATHRNNQGAARINLVGNYYVNGPMKKSKYFFRGGGGPASPTEIFQSGNRHDPDQDADHNGFLAETPEQIATAFNRLDDDDRLVAGDTPFGFIQSIPPDAVLSANAAYQRVVESVGASLWRDAVDERIVRSLADRSGRIIDTQETHRRADGVLPGIDDIQPTHRDESFDQDQDGIADAFEVAHGLDPTDPDDRNGQSLAEEFGLNGLTNLEVFLDSLTRNGG